MAEHKPVDRDELADELVAVIRTKLLERLSTDAMDAHMLATECVDDVLPVLERRFASRFGKPS
jgi:hypothetical protein